MSGDGDTATQHDATFARVADEYLARRRAGEVVTAEEYALAYPALADLIRDLFPALSALARVEQTTVTVSPASPRRLGDFLLLREIGRGGMGVVYEAVQETLGRRVAVKVLHEAYAGRGDAVRRFQREAKAAARLHHTNIVPVFGVGEHGGTHYFAMQYIAGQGLDRVLAAVRQKRADDAANRPADPPSSDGTSVFGSSRADYFRHVARLIAEAAEGLAHAHAQGVLHRDIKPSNLLLDVAGTLFVTDFGLAKVEDEADLTEPDTPIGTLRYMPPERLTGTADPRGDVYALGATLYELLTLRPLIDQPTKLQLIEAIRKQTPPVPPRVHDPRIPRDLETVCLKCADPVPRFRYATAAAVAADLRSFLAGRSIQARPVGVVEAVSKWAKRNPTRAVATAAVVLFVAATAAGVVLAERSAARRQDAATARGLVVALAAAETSRVPDLLAELRRCRADATADLFVLAGSPIDSKPGLHARLALADHPGRADELLAYLPRARPEEVGPLREILGPRPTVWDYLVAEDTPGPDRVRYAAAAAGWAPNDPRWPAVAPAVCAALAVEPTLDAGTWARAFDPVGPRLLPSLFTTYSGLIRNARPGQPVTPGSVSSAAAAERVAALIVRFAPDRPDQFALAATTFDGAHVPRLEPTIRSVIDSLVPFLRRAAADPDPANAVDAGRAAAALLKYAVPADAAWPLFRLTPDPTARTALFRRIHDLALDPAILIRRLETESDVSARRGLLFALGGLDPSTLRNADRPAFVAWLRLHYCDDDPGTRAAVKWLAAVGWVGDRELTTIDEALAGAPRPSSRHWYVTKGGLTATVIPGPVRFDIGAPQDDPDRHADERAAPRLIPRTFAIGRTEITAEEYLRIQSDPPQPAGPSARAAVAISWFDAVAFCNRLSQREGIPPDQWCYEPNEKGEYKSGMRVKRNYLTLTGYRLPTEAEWEYACRAGTTTPRYFGRDPDLLGDYAWTPRTAGDQFHRVARLMPNDLGLFDTLGNALEWVMDPIRGHERQPECDTGPKGEWVVYDGARDGEHNDYQLRGGGYSIEANRARAAYRYNLRPGNGTSTSGFRIARTIATHAER